MKHELEALEAQTNEYELDLPVLGQRKSPWEADRQQHQWWQQKTHRLHSEQFEHSWTSMYKHFATETYCHTEVRCCEKKPKNTTQKERTDILLLILTSWVFMLIGLHASNKLKSKLLVQRVRVWGRFRITLPFYTLFRGVRHNWDVL